MKSLLALILLFSISCDAAYTPKNVISGTNNQRIERVRANAVCSTSPCPLDSNTAGISSVTRVSAGLYQINFPAGTFSATPTCVINSVNGGVFITAANSNNGTGTHSATAFAFATVRTDTSSVLDSQFEIICMGSK